MTNEIKTHRLIVTLPNTSGEEVDCIAARLEDDLETRRAYRISGAAVTHALGETLPAGMHVLVNDFNGLVTIDDGPGKHIALTALEARQLAGALLRLADELEANS